MEEGRSCGGVLRVVWMKVSRLVAGGCHGWRFVSGSDAA